VTWVFGDGQISHQAEPVHVYLRPGLYTVTLEVKRLGKILRGTNRIRVAPPFTPRNAEKENLHDLDTYLPILETYDPAKLDAPSLLQLVEAWRFHRQRLADEGPPTESEDQQALWRERIEAVRRKIVALGEVAADRNSAAKEPEALFAIADLTAPVARDQLLNARDAGQIWHGVARKIGRGIRGAECLGHAADIALTDLLDLPVGKMLLETAEESLPENASGRTASLLQRIRGDFEAASGNGEAARQAYRRAAKLQPDNRSFVQRTAREGSLRRSAEGFLRDEQYARAAAVLRRWQNTFPESLCSGDPWFLFAQYYQGVGRYRQATTMAERLLTIDADSPYADRTLLVAAESEIADDRLARGRAILESIVEDYPGSALVPEVKERLANLPNR
jgi:tetratricopeptide (TPR) repeat protein